MIREENLYIDDILAAIDRILDYIAGMKYEDFEKDAKTYDAVVRNFEIIGEAVGHLSDKTMALHPEFPWAQMTGKRNKLIHEYFGIAPRVVWTTINNDLQLLRQAMTTLRSK